ncbi:MAG: hypothetical protein GY696_35265 [Gammaproteobacteria bacterium]|nr:hypothetical protein [Gammaproteobacteria bacterium]
MLDSAVQHAVQNVVPAAVGSAVSKALEGSKDVSPSETFVPKDMKFESVGIEHQYRCVEETEFHLKKAMAKLQAEQLQLAKESIQRALDVIERRKKDVLVANRSGWAVLSELKSFDSSVFSEKEKADISAAEKKVEKRQFNKGFRSYGKHEASGSNKSFRSDGGGKSSSTDNKGQGAQAEAPWQPGWFPMPGPSQFGPFGGFPSGFGMGRGSGIICHRCSGVGHKADQCWARFPVPGVHSGSQMGQAPKNEAASAQSPPAGITRTA